MNEVFDWFKNLRRYFFLNVSMGCVLVCILLLMAGVCISLLFDIERSSYSENIFELSFNILIAAFYFFFLAQAEALFRFLFEKLILKREIKPIPAHKNQLLQKLDDIYTWFYVITVSLFVLILACGGVVASACILMIPFI